MEGKSMEINKVLVYGTLMTDIHNHHLGKPFIKPLEAAKTLGRFYDLNNIYDWNLHCFQPVFFC